uniref:Uncharacterized protein n=1 Tax=Arundo donax TaxID=35708 RepID=A0A0A9C1A6_ARUDO
MAAAFCDNARGE